MCVCVCVCVCMIIFYCNNCVSQTKDVPRKNLTDYTDCGGQRYKS